MLLASPMNLKHCCEGSIVSALDFSRTDRPHACGIELLLDQRAYVKALCRSFVDDAGDLFPRFDHDQNQYCQAHHVEQDNSGNCQLMPLQQMSSIEAITSHKGLCNACKLESVSLVLGRYWRLECDTNIFTTALAHRLLDQTHAICSCLDTWARVMGSDTLALSQLRQYEWQ